MMVRSPAISAHKRRSLSQRARRDAEAEQRGPVRLVVTSGHIHYPGKWVAHGFPLFENKALKATTREEAEAEVVQMAKEWLSAAVAGLVA